MSTMKQGKRSIVIALVMVMLSVCMLPSMVMADQTIEAGKTGSITVYKYNGNPVEGLAEYVTQAEAKAAADAAVLAGDIAPLPGVVFSYLKVGDVRQYTKNEGTATNVTKIGYSIDAATTTFLGLTATDVDITIGGVDYYTTDTLTTKLAAKTQKEAETFMTANSASAMPATDATGKTNTPSIAQGMYLVIESTLDANTLEWPAPFFVSVPMTDMHADGTFDWIYDVNVYPKNKVQPPRIDKTIKDAEGDRQKQIDEEVGKLVEFEAVATVPHQIGKLQKYTITDTLSVGLTYDVTNTPLSTYTVEGIKADGTAVTLTAGTDFTFTQAGQVLTWDFDPVELGDAEGVALYKGVVITYKVKVNKDAVVGATGNPNSIELEYSKDTDPSTTTTVKTVPTTLPKAYTYAIDLLKYGDGNKANPLEDVTFELQDKDKNAIKVSEQTAGTAGKYYLDAEHGTATLTTHSTGKLYVKGLAAGTYYLEEKATNKGYNLLANPIEITITSNEGTFNASATGTFAPYTAGTKYYADAACEDQFVLPAGITAGKYVNFGTSNVYTAPNTKVATMYEEEALEWTANYSMGATNGEVYIEVDNTKGPRIPKTGDTTALLLYGLGALIAASAVIGAVVTKKKAK